MTFGRQQGRQSDLYTDLPKLSKEWKSFEQTPYWIDIQLQDHVL